MSETRIPKKIILAGCFATNAVALREQKILTRGVAVKLLHEKFNSHDSNAIAVYIDQNKIGYIPRNVNQTLRAGGAIEWTWKILSARKIRGNRDNLFVEIFAPDQYKTKGRVPVATKNLPTASRPEFAKKHSRNIVYEIRQNNKCLYIGKTTNRLIDRKNQHLSLLRKSSHHNFILQQSYNLHGEDSLQFSKVKSGVAKSGLLVEEMKAMQKKNKTQYKETRSRIDWHKSKK